MAMTELGRGLIQNIDDIKKMKPSNPAEAEFARLLIENTNLIVEYEPASFEFADSGGKLVGTVPDFRVTNSSTGKVNYIEITNARGGKSKQKRTMILAGLDRSYKVFYREKLRAIESKFPQYKFVLDVPVALDGNSS